jgi:hypothetical protein
MNWKLIRSSIIPLMLSSAALALVFDVMLFYIIAIPNVTLNPQFDCGQVTSQWNWINYTTITQDGGGCAFIEEGRAYVRYPLFSFALHEALHLKYGYDEGIPFLGTIGVFTLLLIISVKLLWKRWAR